MAPPRARLVDPRQLPDLNHFNCGQARWYEREVNGIVRWFHRYGAIGDGFLVAEHPSTGEVMGICSFTNRPLESFAGLVEDPAYISVIAVQEKFRGDWRLP